jgi:hypothetical protein
MTDTPDAREVIEDVLLQAGCQATCATRGEDCECASLSAAILAALDAAGWAVVPKPWHVRTGGQGFSSDLATLKTTEWWSVELLYTDYGAARSMLDGEWRAMLDAAKEPKA